MATLNSLRRLTLPVRMSPSSPSMNSVNVERVSQSRKKQSHLEVKLTDVPEAGYPSIGTPPRGEIRLRGPSVIEGYNKHPDLNEDPSIITPDGRFRTGDIGQWNPNGTLSVIDRCVPFYPTFID